MSKHRLVAPHNTLQMKLTPPHSYFDFIDREFGGNTAIKRLFSLSRYHNGRYFISEDIDPAGIIDDENEEIKKYFHQHESNDLRRVSFWKRRCLPYRTSKDLIGYAILKKDKVPSINHEEWHIFESVFIGNPYSYTYTKGTKQFKVAVGKNVYCIRGVLYCQQNGLNKSGAHAALRTICSMRLPDDGYISYRKINSFAREAGALERPGAGLSTAQVRAVLTGFGINFHELVYDEVVDKLPKTPTVKLSSYEKMGETTISLGSKAVNEGSAVKENEEPSTAENSTEPADTPDEKPDEKEEEKSSADNEGQTDSSNKELFETLRKRQPYQKFLYSGIESGNGALLGIKTPKNIASAGGFKPPRTELTRTNRHLIPVYGHTFDKDAWIATSGFKAGPRTSYIPSDAWLSSFIGHDDHLGSNFCIPSSHISAENIDYVIEILGKHVKYSGMIAEVTAAEYIYSILENLPESDDQWIKRMQVTAKFQKIVFRAISMTKKEYLSHLKTIRCWETNKKNSLGRKLQSILSKKMPSDVWMVEISLPDLYPINQRKVGEVVLDATTSPDEEMNFSLFLLARLPGAYYFFEKTEDNIPSFVSLPSKINTHTDIY